MELAIWEKISKNDVEEMENIICEEILLTEKKKKSSSSSSSSNSSRSTTTDASSPVIVALEQDLADENDPNTYYLFLAFPTTTTPTSQSQDATAAKGDGMSPGQYRRRLRVPLVEFCELLANAFQAHIITSTTLCFVADASCGMGSDVLSTIVRRCNHGVVRACTFMSSIYFFRSTPFFTGRLSCELCITSCQR